MEDAKFTVGDKFPSLEELETALDRYKKKNYVDFWRRDSRTIAAAQKRGVNRSLNAELKYYEISIAASIWPYGVANRLRAEGLGKEAHRKSCCKICI